MNDLTIIPHSRGIEDVTRDIRIQTGQFLRTAIEIGRLLFEAKAMVEPGGWGKYIEEQLPFSHSWANNYMKLYKEYGSDQTSLFRDSQAFMNLSPTQALELLALPAEDRQQFMEDHNVEEMSTRDLHKEVQAELEKSKAALRDAEQDKLVLQNKVASLESTEGAWEEEIRKLQEKVKAAEDAKAAAQRRHSELSAQVIAAEKKAKDAQAKLREMKKNPQIPEAVMAQMQQEITAEAERKAAENARKELDKLAAELQAAEAARVAAEEQLDKTQKRDQLNSRDVVMFESILNGIQQDIVRLGTALDTVRRRDPELGAKLEKGAKAIVSTLLADKLAASGV